MTERLTDPDGIRDVADSIHAEQGRMTLEELQHEFKTHDLEVTRLDLVGALIQMQDCHEVLETREIRPQESWTICGLYVGD